MADRRNDIDSWFNAYDEGDSPAMPVGDGRSPDDAASERNIADEVGQPPQSVRAYPELFSQSAEASRTRRATQGTPRLQRWISEPENYAVARDDVESLSVFERVLRPSNSGDAAYLDWMALASPLAPFLGAAHLYANRDRVGAGIDPRPHFRLGQLDEEHTQLAFRDRQAEAGLGEPLTDEERARLDELATMPGRDDWGPFIIGPTARLAPQIIGQFRRGVEQGGAGWEESVTDVYGDERARSAIARRVLDGDVGEGARAAILAPIAGVGGAIAGVGGAIGGYLEYGYEMETGGAFDEMVRSGVDRSVAAERSAEYGRWAMALEFVGDALFLPVSGATRFATRTLLGERLLQGGIERAVTRAGGNALRGGGTQGLEETSQELAQIIHQDIAQQETEGASADILQAWRNALTPENIERMLQAGYIGMQGGVGMASIPAGANLALDMRAIRQAERAAGVFEQQTQAAQSSRLNERGLTSTLESAVGAMDSSNVYIDADRFIEHFQSAGANAYAVAEELGIGSDALAEAASSHGQVEIPTARFAARVLRIPQHASLAEHARIAPDADTPAEAKAAEARLQAQIERIAEEVETLSAEQDLGQEVEARVRDLFARAQTEGGPRADVAARYAKLPAALAQALVARARQTDPAYAQKLEGELRAFFTERFGIAGPARDVAASGAELNQRGTGPDAGPVRSDRYDPPEGVRLSERERKIAEMAINGASNDWIADEMSVGDKLVSPSNISVTLNKIKKKLGDTPPPWEAAVGSGRPADVSIERIVKRRDEIGPQHGINAILGEYFGMEPSAIKQRLWNYDREQARLAQLEAGTRREEPFDLHTPEGRADWFEREVLAEPIPGEASDARQYGFALDTGEIIVMSIAPEPTGSATVEWTFLDRLKEQAANPDKEVDLFGPGKEKIGVRGVLALMARVAAVMEADMAEFRRDSYVYTPNNDALENIYKALVNRILEGGATYATIDDGAGTAYIVRDGAKVSRNGTVIASPENANAEPIQWPQLDPEAVRALQNESYERIERFAKEGSPEGAASDGGREGGAGTGDDAGRGVSGTGRRDRGGRGGGEDLSQSDTRGSIRYADFDAGAFGEATIRLGQASDLSTFLHEFGHLGHLVLESIATDPDAPVEFKDMWGATLDWWGLDQEAWNGLSAEQRVPYFEQWARTFEAYLKEGIAPSLYLREAFAAFKQWLLQVYRTVLRLNANLTPEIRSVFDRLLASDAEIAEARAAMGADFKLSREAFKTDEEFQAYVHAIAEAKEAQEAELRALAMDAYARKSKRWWRGERERLRDAATRYVDSDPARRAHDWIVFEQWRDLPSTELSDEGEIGYAGPDNAIEEKPEGLPPMRLASQAIEADWSGIELPAGLKPRVHADEVLAEAMSLKAQDKGRGALRAQRLGQFVRKNKGVQDPDGVIRDAIGSGRKRPGLINANGITPEHMMGRAAAAGYFGPAAAKLYLNEQQAQEAAASIIAARKAGARRSLTSFVRSQGGIKDDRGDIAGSAGDGQRGFARLIRPDGKPLDQIIEAAHAAGHFPDIGPDTLPSAREFIDALDAEARGLGPMEADARAAQMNLRYWQRLGLDTSLPEAELVSALHGAANPSARPMAELAQGNDGRPSNEVAYRGLNRPYDPNNGGYYQSFTSSADDAREYGPHVMAANLRLGRNLAIDGGGNNFNSIGVAQLPAEVRARLHPSIGNAATTDQIAHAAREAGYDSVTVRNVHDTRWGERPAAGEPRTLNFVFDTSNISPLEGHAPPPSQAAPASPVRLSASDRALLDELERDLSPPERPNGGPLLSDQERERLEGGELFQGARGANKLTRADVPKPARMVSLSEINDPSVVAWREHIFRPGKTGGKPAVAIRIIELSFSKNRDGQYLNPTEVAAQMLREGFFKGKRVREAANLVDVRRSLLRSGASGNNKPGEAPAISFPDLEERAPIVTRKQAERWAIRGALDEEAYQLFNEGDGTPVQRRGGARAQRRAGWTLQMIADRQGRSLSDVHKGVARHEARLGDIEVERAEEARAAVMKEFKLPTFPQSGFEARDLVLMFNEGLSDAQMAAELELAGARKRTDPASMGVAQTQVRNAIRRAQDTGAVERLAEAMNVSAEELDAFVANKGKTRVPTIRGEARRLVASGVIENKALAAAIRQYAEINGLPVPGDEHLAVVASHARSEAGIAKQQRVLTAEQRAEVVLLRKEGVGQTEIVERTGFPMSAVLSAITAAKQKGEQFPALNLRRSAVDLFNHADDEAGELFQRDLFPDTEPGSVLVYHGTPSAFAPDDIAPWSHFGTEAAARDRLKATGPEGRILPYVITGRRIHVGNEFPSHIGGNTHGDVTPRDVADLLLRGAHISQEEHAWAIEPLLDGSRFLGRDSDDVVRERISELAARHDIAAIGYGNTVEDEGSTSYIVPNPRENVRPAQDLFQTDDSGKAPSLEEFLATLIADLTGERSVYSSNDKSALAQAQDMEDARAWFEAHDIDLSADKDTIRVQIEAALEADRTSENQWHPDDISGWFGFSSGDELIQALSALKPRSEAIEERIDQMVEEEHGDAFSPDKVKDAARKAAHAEAQSRRIELELSALQAATGGKKTPVSNAARAYAEKRVQLMTVRQIRNYETFLAGERRAARNAMEAKKPADAALWKQKQLISFHLYRFARDAAMEMDRAQNYFQKFDRDTIRAKIHAPLLDQIDQALEGIDLRASPRISDRRRQSFNAWYAEMQSEGLEHMVVADPDFLEAVRQRPFNALTLEEARAIRDAVKNFEHIGRRWREVLGARDARLLDEAVAEMTASMATVKPFEFANTTDHSPGIVESLDVARQGFHAQLSRVEFVARAMDGMKDNGPVWNGLFRPLTEARDREEIRQEQAQGDIENLFSVYSAGERADMWTKRKFYPQVPSRDGSRMGRNFTKQEILAIALNTGNEYNFGALIAGDNWTETQVRALLDAAMDGRDWAFVQSAWDYVESFWPEIEALYLQTAGVAPPKVQPTPFQNQYGEWAGGYWHLEYDYGRDQRVRDEVEHGQVQNAFGGFRMRTQTPNGFSKARQGSGGRPVRLDLSILSEHVNEVIHDLEFRAPVLNAWRLMKHQGFREAFVQAAGQKQYDQLKPWLQYVATEIMPPERGFSGVIKLLRRNTPIALMGYALSTVSQQPAGVMGTFARVGVGRVMGKLMQLSAQPWTWMEHARFINSRSTLMRNRTRISQREIREMVQEINDQAHIDAVNLLVAGTPGQKVQALSYMTKMMQRYALFPLAFLDKWISSAAWKAAYDKAIGGYVTGVDAQNEADAIAYADSIIRTTFGSGRPEDLPPVMRSTELGKLITPAFSYFSTQYNQLYNEQTPGMMRGQISPLEFMTFITFTLVLQALVSEWAAGRWEPDDDESEEERNIRLGIAVAQTPLAGVPLVRDMTRSALQAATTGQTFGSTVPAFGAIGSTGSGIGRAAHDIAEDGQISRAAARDLTMAAGYWFGLPSRQMWTTGSYLSDVAAGDEDPLWDTDEPLDTWSEAFLRDTR